MITQGKSNAPVTGIIVHCSATRANWMHDRDLAAKRAEIRRWHVTPRPDGRGFIDIGYHWLIDRDGAVVAGRAENVIGAHTVGHNTGTIGICLIGGHGSDANDAFADHFTIAQDRALRRLIADIRKRARIATITGHNEHAAKACPGFNVATWMKG